MIALDDFLARLDGVRRSGASHVARCPGHEDRRQSLSVSVGNDGRLLVRCHAGCATEHLLERLDLTLADLMPAREEKPATRPEITAAYDYTDEEGGLLYQVVRFIPKDFRQRRPDGQGGWEWSLGDTRRVLYRLPAVLAAKEAGRRVFVVEGEKDVGTLEHLGFCATTNARGASEWRPEYAETLTGCHVVVIPDNDEAGREHERKVRESLEGRAASVETVYLPALPDKGDVTDWVRNGGTAEALKALVRRGSRPPGVTNLLDAIRDVSRYKTESLPPGIDFPWSALQRRTRGLRPGWFTILAGYPGSGKTAAALEIVFAAAKQDRRSLVNSLEMSAEEISLRLIQRWGLDTERLYANALTANDREAFDLAANFPYYGNVDMTAERTMAGLVARVDEVKPELVVVDYIGLMDMGKADIQEGTARLSRQMKELARTREVPVLCLSQLSRPQDKSRVHVPTMFDLRASGALECDADHIVIVHRDDLHDESKPESEGRFIVAKSRHAPAGKPVAFVFDGRQQTFTLKDPSLERAAEKGWSVYEGGT